MLLGSEMKISSLSLSVLSMTLIQGELNNLADGYHRHPPLSTFLSSLCMLVFEDLT